MCYACDARRAVAEVGGRSVSWVPAASPTAVSPRGSDYGRVSFLHNLNCVTSYGSTSCLFCDNVPLTSTRSTRRIPYYVLLSDDAFPSRTSACHFGWSRSPGSGRPRSPAGYDDFFFCDEWCRGVTSGECGEKPYDQQESRYRAKYDANNGARGGAAVLVLVEGRNGNCALSLS
ncbi:hypothetical protein ANO11243_046440 [Dothideomycetidae sp. 11243]|nr:hypothetical protein ANO11243_046440 [fungal sp. No.11243]